MGSDTSGFIEALLPLRREARLQPRLNIAVCVWEEDILSPGRRFYSGQCNQWLGYLSIDKGDTKDWRAFLPMVPAQRDLATHIVALLNMVCAYSVR